MSLLNEIKTKSLEKIDWFLLRVDIRLHGNGGRIVALIFAIYFSFSVIGDLSSIRYNKALIHTTELRLEQGSASLVNELLEKCNNVDLSNADLVDECIANSKSEMLAKPKSKITEAWFDLFFLVVFSIIIIGGYLFLIFRQKEIRAKDKLNNQNDEAI